MDYATSYGIDFWALCTYPIGCADYHPPDSECPKIQCCADNYALSYALERYLEVEQASVNFSLILQVQLYKVLRDVQSKVVSLHCSSVKSNPLSSLPVFHVSE